MTEEELARYSKLPPAPSKIQQALAKNYDRENVTRNILRKKGKL